MLIKTGYPNILDGCHFLCFKAGVNVKAALTSPEHGRLSANISVTFQATLNPSVYFIINHCSAVLC